MTDTGTVVGTLVDSAHPTVPIQTAVIQIGVRIARLSPADGGKFVIDNVPTGTQGITITSPGFAGYSAQVVVRKDQTSDLGVIGLASQAP